MNEPLMQAASDLARALEAENDALRAMDVPRAVAQFPAKAEGARRLRAALTQPERMPPEQLAAARAGAARLQALAADNRRLLERAMFVQGRLIATLARAAPVARVGYGHVGHRAPTAAGQVPPMTLSARA